MTIAYNIKGIGTNKGSDKGSVVSTNFTPNLTQTSGSNTNTNTSPTVKTLSNFAGSYNITVDWRMLDDSDNGTDTGTVTIDNNGTVTSCTNFEIFVNCRGTLVLNANKDGAVLTIDGWGTVEEVGGSAVINATVSSAYKVSGTASGKNELGATVVSGTFNGSKNK